MHMQSQTQKNKLMNCSKQLLKNVVVPGSQAQ